MWKLIHLEKNIVQRPDGKWSNGYTIKDGMVFDPDTDTWNELDTSFTLPIKL